MKTVFKLFATILLLAIAIVFAMQAVTYIWTFPEAKPFFGTNFYNPYAGIPMSNSFLKANFHAHTCVDTRHEYTTKEFINAYKNQNYDIIGITEHQIINDKGAIPSYEHGMGLNNFHIGMYDARNVDWIDNAYMLLPLHQMQSAFHRLQYKSDVIVFNHSDRLRLMSCDGIEYLREYDLFEIPPTAIEEENGGIADIWDRVLSTGYYVPLVSNDDAHSIINRDSQFQRAYTMVYGGDGNILTALTMGHSYGVCLSNTRNSNGHTDMPQILSIDLIGNRLSISTDKTADTITFIGQGGKILQQCANTEKGEYTITDEDTYVRIEAKFDGVLIFTNPVARVPKGGFIFEMPQIDHLFSILNWALWTLLFAADIFVIILIWGKKSRNSHYDRTAIGLGLKPLEWY